MKPLLAKYRGDTYDFALPENEATWWTILRALELATTGTPFDEGLLRDAGYALTISVERYEDGICHHLGECTFGCEDRAVGPVWGYTVRDGRGSVLCSECESFTTRCRCVDCPAARHAQVCKRCRSQRFFPPTVVACTYCKRALCERAMRCFAHDGDELAAQTQVLLAGIEVAARAPLALTVGYGRFKVGLQKLGVSVREALSVAELTERIEAHGTPALRRDAFGLATSLAEAAGRSLRNLAPKASQLRNDRSSCDSCARERTLMSPEDVASHLLAVCDGFVNEQLSKA